MNGTVPLTDGLGPWDIKVVDGLAMPHLATCKMAVSRDSVSV